MASDKMKAVFGLGRLVVAVVVGYAIANVWAETRGPLDEWYVPYAAGVIATIMVFVLLTKLKGGGD